MFKERQQIRRAFHNASRQAGQRRHLNAVRFVARSISNGVKKPQLTVRVGDLDVDVAQTIDFPLEADELVIVGGEKRPCADARTHVFGDRPGDGQPVKG